MDCLPSELLVLIVSELDDNTQLTNMRLVGREWHRALNRDEFWRLLCEKVYGPCRQQLLTYGSFKNMFLKLETSGVYIDSNNPDDPVLIFPEETKPSLFKGFTLSFWIYLFKDVVHENKRHNSYRTLVQSPGLFSLYLRPYDNSVVLIVPDPDSETGVRYKINTWQELVPLQWNHVVFSFEAATDRTLTRVNGVSDTVIDPNVKQLLFKRWDTRIQQAGTAPLSRDEGILRALKILSPHIDPEEPLLTRSKPHEICTAQELAEKSRAIVATQDSIEFSFGGGCWVCDLCRQGVIKAVHYDCTECSLDVCGQCWKKAAWTVPYDRGCQHTSFYRLKNPRQVICDILPRDPSIAVNVDI
jgi:hypothetical protein